MEQPASAQLKKAFIRIVCALVLFAAAFWVISIRPAGDELDVSKVVPPTCTDSGYTLYTYQKTGATQVRDVIPPLGHQFGAWKLTEEGSELEPTRRSRQCTVCGSEETTAEYPVIGLARLSLNGSFDGIGKKTEVPLTAQFVSEEISFTDYATAKYQGHSSLNYAKKNYTVKFYRDAQFAEKDKLIFSHWNPENKYILKANYQDPSQSKNLVSADIWADMVRTRDYVPGELEALSNYGAVDGFPVALYLNDSFQGLYTMNLHKDDDLFGMEDGQDHAIIIINEETGEDVFFRSEVDFDSETPWEIEFCGTADTTWAQKKLNTLIRFINTADDETFQRDIGNYLDVDSAIDYLIAMYALGLQEHSSKDLVLAAYGRSEPWICSMYDMEEAFDTGGVLPVYRNGTWDSGTGNLLWDRLLNCYFDEICTRYRALRKSTLDPDTLCRRIEEYVAQIPEALYHADAQIHDTEIFTYEKVLEMTGDIRILIKQTDSIFDFEGV